jgi:hypothetical protein
MAVSERTSHFSQRHLSALARGFGRMTIFAKQSFAHGKVVMTSSQEMSHAWHKEFAYRTSRGPPKMHWCRRAHRIIGQPLLEPRTRGPGQLAALRVIHRRLALQSPHAAFEPRGKHHDQALERPKGRARRLLSSSDSRRTARIQCRQTVKTPAFESGLHKRTIEYSQHGRHQALTLVVHLRHTPEQPG